MGGLISPNGRLPRHWSSLKNLQIRALPEPIPGGAFMHFKTKVAKRICKKCSLCGESVMAGGLAMHCREKGDLGHLVLEVMET